jgi:hypothetical protein
LRLGCSCLVQCPQSSTALHSDLIPVLSDGGRLNTGADSLSSCYTRVPAAWHMENKPCSACIKQSSLQYAAVHERGQITLMTTSASMQLKTILSQAGSRQLPLGGSYSAALPKLIRPHEKHRDIGTHFFWIRERNDVNALGETNYKSSDDVQALHDTLVGMSTLACKDGSRAYCYQGGRVLKIADASQGGPCCQDARTFRLVLRQLKPPMQRGS